MNLRRAFLLALGVAVPLWVRQYRFEHYLTRSIQESLDEGGREFERGFERFKKWADELTKELSR